MLPVTDAYTLPSLYHWNSEPWLNLEAYSNPTHEMLFKTTVPEGTGIPLPDAAATPLANVIRRRRSCRKFADETMELSTLGSILGNTYGITGLVDDPTGLAMYSRPIPSAGALYPLEIYVLTRRVDGLADGLYHYQARDHLLKPTSQDAKLEMLGEYLLGQYYLNTANVAIILTAVFERTFEKYGPRGYRYVLFEAGHAAQNLCLLATEAGLGSICLGGFFDARLNRHLALDGKAEAALYVVGLGHEER